MTIDRKSRSRAEKLDEMDVGKEAAARCHGEKIGASS
jgi:hypothetical protein